jgi:hypothetical protein
MNNQPFSRPFRSSTQITTTPPPLLGATAWPLAPCLPSTSSTFLPNYGSILLSVLRVSIQTSSRIPVSYLHQNWPHLLCIHTLFYFLRFATGCPSSNLIGVSTRVPPLCRSCARFCRALSVGSEQLCNCNCKSHGDNSQPNPALPLVPSRAPCHLTCFSSKHPLSTRPQPHDGDVRLPFGHGPHAPIPHHPFWDHRYLLSPSRAILVAFRQKKTRSSETSVLLTPRYSRRC